MSKAIKFILNKIHSSIPRPLIMAAFNPNTGFTGIDNAITEKIVSKILMSINSVIGRLIFIPLAMTKEESISDGISFYNGPTGSKTILRIPPEARDYADINSVIRVAPMNYLASYGYQMGSPYYFSNSGGNNALNIASLALASRTLEGALDSPACRLLDGNLVEISPGSLINFVNAYTLVCTVEYDSQFTNITQHAYDSLAHMALVAAKKYIYMNTIIDLNRLATIGGQSLDDIKSIVDSYNQEGSEEAYDEAFENVKGALLMSQDMLKQLVYYQL